MEVQWIDPEQLFPKHPPYQRLYENGEQSDLTEVGMQSYLQILPSVALYGFKYAVEINKAGGVLNGDFRTFAARELGMKLPVVYHRIQEGRTLVLTIIIRRLRKLFNKPSLFFRKIENPGFEFGKVKLVCKFQLPLFDSIYPERTDLAIRELDKPSNRKKITTIINYYRKKVLP